MSDKDSGFCMLILLSILVICISIIGIYIESRVEELETQVEQLQTQLAESPTVEETYLELSDTITDNKFTCYLPVTYEDTVHFYEEVTFEGPVHFHSAVHFANGEVTFVEPPLAAYD